MRYVLLLLMFVSADMSAGIYKWTDENGKVHFSDKPPLEQKAEQINEAALNAKISTFTHVSVEIVPFDFGLNKSSNDVILYATKWCGYCAKARKYFKENNIEYTEKDIEESKEARQEYDDFGGTGIPVIFAGQYRMNGFSNERFAKLYKKASNNK